MYRIDETVALNVWPTVMTSSPGSEAHPREDAHLGDGPVAHRDRVADADELRPAFLELRDALATGEHPAAQDLGDGGDLGVVDVGAGDRDHGSASRSVSPVAVVGVAAAAAGAGELRVGRVAPDLRRRGMPLGVHEPVAAGAHPADPLRGAPGDERVPRDGARHDGPGADHRERPDIAAGDDDGARADRAAVLEPDRGDLPVVGAGQLALGGDRPRVAVVGEDRARADEHAVGDRDAVVDERAVLDLHAVADLDALIDEGVTADHALGADAGAACGPAPAARSRCRPRH